MGGLSKGASRTIGIEERDDELLLEFVDESAEQLDRTEQALLAFEQSPVGGRAQLATALRCLHSLKGSAGYVSLFEVQDVCHAAEDLIGRLGSFDPTRARHGTDLALTGVTLLRERFDEVRDACNEHREILVSAAVSEWLVDVKTA